MNHRHRNAPGTKTCDNGSGQGERTVDADWRIHQHRAGRIDTIRHRSGDLCGVPEAWLSHEHTACPRDRDELGRNLDDRRRAGRTVGKHLGPLQHNDIRRSGGCGLLHSFDSWRRPPCRADQDSGFDAVRQHRAEHFTPHRRHRDGLLIEKRDLIVDALKRRRHQMLGHVARPADRSWPHLDDACRHSGSLQATWMT